MTAQTGLETIIENLFIPETFFTSIDARKTGLAALRQAQATQILRVVEFNLTEPAFIAKLTKLTKADDVKQALIEVISNLTAPVVEANPLDVLGVAANNEALSG